MLCYVMLCYVMLCYVMLCYVMLGIKEKEQLEDIRTGKQPNSIENNDERHILVMIY